MALMPLSLHTLLLEAHKIHNYTFHCLMLQRFLLSVLSSLTWNRMLKIVCSDSGKCIVYLRTYAHNTFIYVCIYVYV